MAGIDQDDIQKVREATDIVSVVGETVSLRQRGSDFWGCCPFHNEKSPSFKVDGSTQLWHCFGCGEGGDLFSYVMKRDNLSFPEAVRQLADKAHIDLKESTTGGPSSSRKQKLKEICKATAEFYHAQLMRSPDEQASSARRYLGGRHLGGDVPKIWNLGFAPGRNKLITHLRSLGFAMQDMVDANVVVASNGKYRDRFFDRVMFPINDITGSTIAFGGRVIGKGEPKYLNSQETPIFHKSNVLYGLDKAKASMASSGIAVVCEGYTDVIALHEAGIGNAVATLGTSLTRSHIRVLSRHASKKIIYLFDGDEAGQRATERALQFIDETTDSKTRSNLDIYALTLPDGLDPQEYVEKFGTDAMNERLDEAIPLVSFGIKRRLSKHDLSSAQSRYKALLDVLSILAPIKDSPVAKDYAIEVAGYMNLNEQDVLKELAKLKKPDRYPTDEDGGIPQGAANASSDANANLPVSDVNRLSLEREFLSLLAQNPLDAINYSDIVSSLLWQDKTHAAIADSIVATLLDDLAATPAQIVEAAGSVCRNASSILTSARKREGKSEKQVLDLISKELAIGDKEMRINELRAKLNSRDAKASEDADGLFKELISLQREITEDRAHLQSLA